MSQNLELTQTQRLRLTRQQLQFVRLLELNAPEMDEAVERELEENPALEPEYAAEPEKTTAAESRDTTPWYLRSANNGTPDTDYDIIGADTDVSLFDYLERQLDERTLSLRIRAGVVYIIGNLDSNGYLRRPLTNILDDLAFGEGLDLTDEEGEEALETVRSLDPAGIGAESLRECLLLQLQRLPASEERNDAISIVSDWFEAFSMRHSHKIASGLKLDPSRIDRADALIRSLNPKPGAPYGGARETAAAVILEPDFAVGRDEDERLTVAVCSRHPELKIEESFAEAAKALEGRRGKARKGSEFVLNRYTEARDFIQMMQQRRQTMMAVMTAIVSRQRDYFETGDVYRLRPMMIKDLAADTGLDLSVISRATANKYTSTPWGAVIPLRSLFSDEKGDSEQGETLTNRQIEAEIERLVNAEDKRHPLSDERLREEMEKRGYNLSRRTIAKYRDRLGILVARLRKKL